MHRTGRVILVGAGPGDPGLLTRRGAEALAAADVVLYDRLVGRAVLDLANPAATLVAVGKGKGAGCDQRHIEALLVDFARRGHDVVRLKGGDPFVFGRGAEEVAACRAAGVTVEVVPGVSSALAAPALAGIPVTHRDLASHVTVVSGHRAGDEGQDWRAIAGAGGTIVVLMAASTSGAVARHLLDAGMHGGTPVAVVIEASHPAQRVLRGTLAELAARERPLAGPCVVVVGAVAALADQAEALAADLAATCA
jgi:uroporphyrin-III C-methyltransferase